MHVLHLWCRTLPPTVFTESHVLNDRESSATTVSHTRARCKRLPQVSLTLFVVFFRFPLGIRLAIILPSYLCQDYNGSASVFLLGHGDAWPMLPPAAATWLIPRYKVDGLFTQWIHEKKCSGFAKYSIWQLTRLVLEKKKVSRYAQLGKCK